MCGVASSLFDPGESALHPSTQHPDRLVEPHVVDDAPMRDFTDPRAGTRLALVPSALSANVM
ncbi:MAG: hypothetical protein ABIP93_04205 [Gemmatimonadaceae bacterium]